MYRIMYGSKDDKHNQKGRGRAVIMTAVIFLIFCTAVCIWWPEGRFLLRTMLIPGDPETTLQAAEVFAAELASGYSFSDTVKNFCSLIVENGYSG